MLKLEAVPMTQSRMQMPLVRGLAVYLALALLPTPILISWFLTQRSSASAVDEEDTRERQPSSLTDLAPPQPPFVLAASAGPTARLARLGLLPRELSPDEQVAQFGPHFADANDAREYQLASLTAQLGDRGVALAVIAEADKPLAGTPPLHLPGVDVDVPDPFVPLPARANYKRADRTPTAR
jgi:hypothetical protein